MNNTQQTILSTLIDTFYKRQTVLFPACNLPRGIGKSTVIALAAHMLGVPIASHLSEEMYLRKLKELYPDQCFFITVYNPSNVRDAKKLDGADCYLMDDMPIKSHPYIGLIQRNIDQVPRNHMITAKMSAHADEYNKDRIQRLFKFVVETKPIVYETPKYCYLHLDVSNPNLTPVDSFWFSKTLGIVVDNYIITDTTDRLYDIMGAEAGSRLF